MVEALRDNNVSRIQQTLRSRGTGSVVVVRPGQLQNLKGIESLSRLPNLHRELTDFIGSRLGIKVTDIRCDAEGKLAILAANPSFIERLKNSNGNLEALGHKVVLEMADENSGRILFLKNRINCQTVEGTADPREIDNGSRKFEPFAVPSLAYVREQLEWESKYPPQESLYTEGPDAALVGPWAKKFGAVSIDLIKKEFHQKISTADLAASLDIDSIPSRVYFCMLGIFLARKLRGLEREQVQTIVDRFKRRPAGSRSIGNTIDLVDAYLREINAPAPSQVEGIPEYFLDSSGQIGASPVPSEEKIILVLSSAIMNKSNGLKLPRSEALVNNLSNFIKHGITSEEDMMIVIEVLKQTFVDKAVDLPRSGKTLIFEREQNNDDILALSQFKESISVLVGDQAIEVYSMIYESRNS